MITGSQKCSTGLSYFKVKDQLLGFGGWHCTGGGREPFEKLSGEQPGSCVCCPSWKDGVFTASGTLLYHCLIVGEESSRNCLLVAAHALCLLLSRWKSTTDQEVIFSTLQQYLVIPGLWVPSKHTQQFYKLFSIPGQCLVAPWPKAVQAVV